MLATATGWAPLGGWADSCGSLAEQGAPTTEPKSYRGCGQTFEGHPSPCRSRHPGWSQCWASWATRAQRPRPPPRSFPWWGREGGLLSPPGTLCGNPTQSSGNLLSWADGAAVKVEGKNTLSPWTEKEVPENGVGGGSWRGTTVQQPTRPRWSHPVPSPPCPLRESWAPGPREPLGSGGQQERQLRPAGTALHAGGSQGLSPSCEGDTTV